MSATCGACGDTEWEMNRDGSMGLGPCRVCQQPTEVEVPVKRYAIYLCDLCIGGAGGECHVPGCALWMHSTPDTPIIVDDCGMCVPFDVAVGGLTGDGAP